MVILSKNDKDDEAGTSSARGLYDILRGGSSQVRLGSHSNSRTSYESNTSRATSAVPLATLFPQLSIAQVAAAAASRTSQQASASSDIQASSGVRITGSRSNSRTSNESNTSRATSAVPLATLFPQLSIARVAAAAASRTSQRASASSDIQASSGVRITEIPTQSGFDPTTFDPTRYTLHEANELFQRNGLRMTNGIVAKVLVRYSLILHGFPPCPEEDLMLAVYFYLEETFGIRARMIACYRYKERNHRREAEERVGVIFFKFQIAENILSRASSVPESGIKVKPNKSDYWILFALAKLDV